MEIEKSWTMPVLKNKEINIVKCDAYTCVFYAVDNDSDEDEYEAIESIKHVVESQSLGEGYATWDCRNRTSYNSKLWSCDATNIKGVKMLYNIFEDTNTSGNGLIDNNTSNYECVFWFIQNH